MFVCPLQGERQPPAPAAVILAARVCLREEHLASHCVSASAGRTDGAVRVVRATLAATRILYRRRSNRAEVAVPRRHRQFRQLGLIPADPRSNRRVLFPRN